MKYKSKPVIIEALQFGIKVGSAEKIIDWAHKYKVTIRLCSEGLRIPTLEGNMIASRGDFIIKGTKNEFYPCKPDVFETKYEKVD